MYSTLDDLIKFYRYIRSKNLFDTNRRMVFLQPSVTLDGSDRGFELFNVYKSEGNQAYLFLNKQGDTGKMRELFRALEQFVAPPKTE